MSQSATLWWTKCPKLTSNVSTTVHARNSIPTWRPSVRSIRTLSELNATSRRKLVGVARIPIPAIALTKCWSKHQDDLEFLNSIKTKDFVPLPSVKVSSEERENFVENTKLQKNDLQITINKIEGVSGHAELKIRTSKSQITLDQCSRLTKGRVMWTSYWKWPRKPWRKSPRRLSRLKLRGRRCCVQ